MLIDKDVLLQLSEYSPEDVGLLYLADKPGPRDLQTLAEVADSIREREELDPQDRLDIWEPERSPYGPVLFIENGLDVPEYEQFLDALGERMDAAGLAGQLTVAPQQWPSYGSGTESYHLLAFVAGLSTVMREDQRWPAQELVDHALQWCQIPGGEYYVSFGRGLYRVPASSRRHWLEEALQGTWAVKIASFAGRDQLREVDFGYFGAVEYKERYPGIDDPAAWSVGLEDLTEVLKDTSAFLNYGIVRRKRFWDDWANPIDFQWPPDPNLPSRKEFVLAAKKRPEAAVPDAFAAMVLSPSHNWSPPALEWAVDPLPGGRTLVRFKKPEALFGEARPDQETVARMRDDMAPILMPSGIPAS